MNQINAGKDRENIQKERQEFSEAIKTIDIFKLVFLDESSLNLAYSRNHGLSFTTKRIKEGAKMHDLKENQSYLLFA
ncbi:MAG: hypothetical protein RRY79_05440 [Clostridia bacterium]